VILNVTDFQVYTCIYPEIITILRSKDYHPKIMRKKVLYTRVSSFDKNSERQLINAENYDMIIEDKVSGSIALFHREGGKKIQALIEKGVKIELFVHSIDRLGRDLKDILVTLDYFSSCSIPVSFISQGFSTMTSEGKVNAISKLLIGILGTVAEMERNAIKERQLEGIQVAKMKGIYKGRSAGSKENVQKFLSKTQNEKALRLLEKGYKGSEVSKIVGIHVNTVTKIKKLGIQSKNNN
jgi:DNA invertase Pin-like site-specific DNA recombinase